MLLATGKSVLEYRTRNAVRGKLRHILYETRRLNEKEWQNSLFLD